MRAEAADVEVLGVHAHLLIEADGAELLCEEPREVERLGGRRAGRRIVRAPGGDPDVAEKTVAGALEGRAASWDVGESVLVQSLPT